MLKLLLANVRQKVWKSRPARCRMSADVIQKLQVSDCSVEMQSSSVRCNLLSYISAAISSHETEPTEIVRCSGVSHFHDAHHLLSILFSGLKTFYLSSKATSTRELIPAATMDWGNFSFHLSTNFSTTTNILSIWFWLVQRFSTTIALRSQCHFEILKWAVSSFWV